MKRRNILRLYQNYPYLNQLAVPLLAVPVGDTWLTRRWKVKVLVTPVQLH